MNNRTFGLLKVSNKKGSWWPLLLKGMQFTYALPSHPFQFVHHNSRHCSKLGIPYITPYSESGVTIQIQNTKKSEKPLNTSLVTVHNPPFLIFSLHCKSLILLCYSAFHARIARYFPSIIGLWCHCTCNNVEFCVPHFQNGTRIRGRVTI